MSRTVYSLHGLTVTRIAGSVALGDDRRLWEFHVPASGVLPRLNAAELRELRDALAVDETMPAHVRAAHYGRHPLPPGADPL